MINFETYHCTLFVRNQHKKIENVYTVSFLTRITWYNHDNNIIILFHVLKMLLAISLAILPFNNKKAIPVS